MNGLNGDHYPNDLAARLEAFRRSDSERDELCRVNTVETVTILPGLTLPCLAIDRRSQLPEKRIRNKM